MDAQILAEMNNMQIRMDECDDKIVNQAAVITKLEQSRKDTKKDRKALLRVARAAEKANEHPDYTDEDGVWKELDEALSELPEHLLD